MPPAGLEYYAFTESDYSQYSVKFCTNFLVIGRLTGLENFASQATHFDQTES